MREDEEDAKESDKVEFRDDESTGWRRALQVLSNPEWYPNHSPRWRYVLLVVIFAGGSVPAAVTWAPKKPW